MKFFNNFIKNILYLLVLWIPGLVLGIVFWILVLFGYVKIKGIKHMPWKKPGTILCSNHPSLVEPFLLVALFFPRYLFFPHRHAPISTPDYNNFHKPWYLRWFDYGPMVPIHRGNKVKEISALKQICRYLKDGRNMILFPEGGRTGKQKEFAETASGKRLGKFKPGMSFAVRASRANILPIWVDNAANAQPIGKIMPKFSRSKPIIIKIGRLIPYWKFERQCEGKKGLDLEKIDKFVSEAMLKLADI